MCAKKVTSSIASSILLASPLTFAVQDAPPTEFVCTSQTDYITASTELLETQGECLLDLHRKHPARHNARGFGRLRYGMDCRGSG